MGFQQQENKMNRKFVNYEYIVKSKVPLPETDFNFSMVANKFLNKGIESLDGTMTSSYVITVKTLATNMNIIRIKKKSQKRNDNATFIFINSNLDSPIISVSKSRDFKSISIVIKVITVIMNKYLNKKGLFLESNRISVKKDFWEIVGEKSDQIKELHFEYYNSSLKNSSKVIPTKLRMLFEISESQKNKIVLMGGPRKSLKSITKFNKVLNPLIKYSTLNELNIKVKFLGENKYHNTVNNQSIIEIKEFDYENIENLKVNLNRFI